MLTVFPPSDDSGASSTATHESNATSMPTVHQVELADVNIEGLSVVGGLDISFREDGNGDEGIAVLAVLSFPQLKVWQPFSTVHDIAM